jgi:hypothetical protein
MDPTAGTRKPKIQKTSNLLHVDQTVQFNLGSISETHFQASTFSSCPKQTDWNLVIILVLVGMLREPI